MNVRSGLLAAMALLAACAERPVEPVAPTAAARVAPTRAPAALAGPRQDAAATRAELARSATAGGESRPAAGERRPAEADSRGSPHRAAAIRIRAVDTVTGEPIAGASVVLGSGANREDLRTDAEGWAETTVAGRGRTHLVRVRALGYGSRTLTVGPPTELPVPLRPWGTLRGYLVDRRTGTPVPDAKVRRERFQDGGTGHADGFGRFELERVPLGGEVALRIDAPGYPRQSVEVAAEPGRDVRVELSHGERVFGHVLDEASGAAVPGARVVVDGWTYPADRFGAFEFEVLADPGSARVIVDAPEHCRLQATVRPSPRGVDLLVRRSASLTGVVRDDRGPLAGARVQVSDANLMVSGDSRTGFAVPAGGVSLDRDRALLPRQQASRTVTTDAEGRYTIEGLVPGAEGVTLRVEHARLGERRFRADVRARPGGTTRVDLYPGCPEERAATAAPRRRRVLVCSF